MSSFGVNVEIQYLRDCAKSIRERVNKEEDEVVTVPGGADGIAALVLRQAATFILNAASLAESFEADRLLKENGKDVPT